MEEKKANMAYSTPQSSLVNTRSDDAEWGKALSVNVGICPVGSFPGLSIWKTPQYSASSHKQMFPIPKSNP